MTTRIAVWSGPRNLSTALMRSFGARPDTTVVDEPLYAAYLASTGLTHPMREQVLASQPTDWRQVVEQLLGPWPTPVCMQKQMAHHLLPDQDWRWLAQVHNVLLLRHPRRVVASYARKRAQVAVEDLGYHQQLAILDWLEAHDQPVWAVDAEAIQRAPANELQRLCDQLGIPWTDAMLRWPSGAHAEDGVWGVHWYASVRASTGFTAPPPMPDDLGDYESLVTQLEPVWRELQARTEAT